MRPNLNSENPPLSWPSIDGGAALYLDIGGTAIKSAVLPVGTGDELLELFRSSLITQFDYRPWSPPHDWSDFIGSLPKMAGDRPIQTVRISIGGSEVSSDGREYRGWLRPPNTSLYLATEIEQSLGLTENSVFIRHDSLAWGHGVKTLIGHCHNLSSGSIGILALGTAVAFSVVSKDRVEAWEITDRRYDWAELRKFARIGSNAWLHDHLARRYFEWSDWKGEGERIATPKINQRMQLLLDGLSRVHSIDHFIIGGGYGDRLEPCNFSQRVEVLTTSNVGFSPAFIPMIGTANQSDSPDLDLINRDLAGP